MTKDALCRLGRKRFQCLFGASIFCCVCKSCFGVFSNARNCFLSKISHVHTITSDNGSEFAKHEEISLALNADFFFAHPYSSWERGLNENTNGLVRQYIKKGSQLLDVTDQSLAIIADKLNDRPRKTLGYKTPREVFHK